MAKHRHCDREDLTVVSVSLHVREGGPYIVLQISTKWIWFLTLKPFWKIVPAPLSSVLRVSVLSPQQLQSLMNSSAWLRGHRSLRQGSTTSFRAPTSVAECPKWMSSNWLFSCTNVCMGRHCRTLLTSCTNHPISRVTSRTPSCSASSTSLIVRRTSLSTLGVRTFPVRVCGRLCHRISFPTYHFLFSAQSPEDFLSLILLTYLLTTRHSMVAYH